VETRAHRCASHRATEAAYRARINIRVLVWIVKPIVVEVVDTREKLVAFLDLIDDNITEGLATLEKAEIRLYRSRKPE